MVLSHYFGRRIQFNESTHKWIYCDNKQDISVKRECPLCGKYETNEGHDPCIANLPGVKHACCGHGIMKPYIVHEDYGEKIEFDTISDLRRYFKLE
jgi:hypothetical protein